MSNPLEQGLVTGENVTILVADDEPSFRSLIALELRNSVSFAEVVQASDGAEAVQFGLQLQPQIALLDVCMPRLGGIEAALTLRSLRPAMKIALQSADAEEHRVRAGAAELLLFDKRDLEQPLAWVKAVAGSLSATREQRARTVTTA